MESADDQLALSDQLVLSDRLALNGWLTEERMIIPLLLM